MWNKGRETSGRARYYRELTTEESSREPANRSSISPTLRIHLPRLLDIVKMLFFNLGDAARLIYGFNSRISFRG